jgi:hypothetical protein
MKVVLLGLIICLFCSPLYATWSEYKSVQYMDFDGDLVDEIIIKTAHGAGSGHYIENVRIFKDDGAEFELIFMETTLDSYFGYGTHNNDTVTSIEFSEPNIESGIRDIVTKTETRYYKDNDHEVFDRKEDLGAKVFRWDGAKFMEPTVSLEK